MSSKRCGFKLFEYILSYLIRYSGAANMCYYVQVQGPQICAIMNRFKGRKYVLLWTGSGAANMCCYGHVQGPQIWTIMYRIRGRKAPQIFQISWFHLHHIRTML